MAVSQPNKAYGYSGRKALLNSGIAALLPLRDTQELKDGSATINS